LIAGELASTARAERTFAVPIPLAPSLCRSWLGLEMQAAAFGVRSAHCYRRMEKTGIVQTFNISPKGGLEGLLMNSEREIIQINFRQEFADEIAALTE